MQGPERLLRHLTQLGYSPRSNAHSNAICLGILGDLLEHCAVISGKSDRGEIVATLNHTVTVNRQRWNIDLAMGPPPGGPRPPVGGEAISMATPAVIEIAVEAKGVMTEHGKARFNRLRDLQAFHNHAHLYNQKVVAVGVVVVNMARIFWSPTRNVTDITRHENIDKLGPATVETYRDLPLRNEPTDPPGLEATCVVVVKHDNLFKNPIIGGMDLTPGPTTLMTTAPAPGIGDPLNYSTMIHRVCTAYQDRWT